MQTFQQQLQFSGRFGITDQLKEASVRGRDFDIDHLHGGKLLQYTARRQSRRMWAQLLRQSSVQTVGQECDEAVGFDPIFVFVTLYERI